MTAATAPTATAGPRATGAVIGTVVLVTAIAPLATDMYVPGFPEVVRELRATPALVQLTLTTFFAGMAAGQLIGGPVSDLHGRRRLLILGTVLFTLASIACALAPTLPALALARLVQGFGGGWAMVVARAVVVDLSTGPALVRALNVVAGVGGIGLIVGPLAGGAIVQFTDWRVSFWVLTVAGAAMVACAVAFAPESLPAERRHGGGFRSFASAAKEVCGDRRYIGYTIVATAAMVAVFGYVSTSAFLLQTAGGLSPLAYSAVFAGNAAAASVAALASARVAGRVSTRALILVGLLLATASGLTLVVGGLVSGPPLALVLVCFFVLMIEHGLVSANGGALASAAVPRHPGTGSAVLGLFQWLAAGLTAPIAAAGGDDLAVSAGLVILVAMVAGLVGLLVLAKPQGPART